MSRYSTRLQARLKAESDRAAVPDVPALVAPAPDVPAPAGSNRAAVQHILDEIPHLTMLEKIQQVVALFRILVSDPTLTKAIHSHLARSVLLDRIQYFRAEHEFAQTEFTKLSKVYYDLVDLNRCVAAQTELRTEMEDMRRLLHHFALLEHEMADVERLCT